MFEAHWTMDEIDHAERAHGPRLSRMLHYKAEQDKVDAQRANETANGR